MDVTRADEGMETVLARATSGDEVAFARIIAAHHGDMARVCQVICGDAQLAQDAVQAAWPLVWRKIGSLRDPLKLRPWLMAVAANEARRLARQQGRRQVREITLEAEHTQPPGVADLSDRAALIDLANSLARLNERDRTIVGMRYAAGMSSAEIGSVIRMTSGGVRARIARLLKVLREDLRDE